MTSCVLFLTADTAWAVPAASLSAGLAGACFSNWVFCSAKVAKKASVGVYEDQRLSRLRMQSKTYRLFEGHVAAIMRHLGSERDDTRKRLKLALRSDASTMDWMPREFIATKIVEGVIVGCVVLALVSLTGVWQLAILFGFGLMLSYPFLSVQSVSRRFETRLRRQRVRFPFVIDQIALMMQAGENFEESLRSVAREDVDHPLTEELRRVLGDLTAGRTRREAFEDLKNRIPEPEIGELISSIIKAEELGTPLSTILSEQAEQMRVKRSQWGEKAAAEAEVQIVFPGMLVMVACLIVVLGPIMLPAVMNVLGAGE